MDKKINNNGYEYVDLGLPSGTLWSTQNVGASKPSDTGLYFQWGDTQGYTADQLGKDKQFNWNDYKWNPSGDGKTFTKYTTPSEALELEDDAANANMGGDWHMPNPKQIQELIDNTTSEWITLDGVNGMKFTSKKNKLKSIFIPAAGIAWNGSINGSGLYGDIWSSMLNMNYADVGQYIDLSVVGVLIEYGYYRDNGLSIRGVIG